jgi:hypothetical protein
METKNSIIRSADISIERGCLSAWLHLDYGGSGQGFGGYVLYVSKSSKHHNMRTVAGHFIHRVLEIADVTRWADLPGKTIRAVSDQASVKKIGHITKDDWFNPSSDFKNVESDEVVHLEQLRALAATVADGNFNQADVIAEARRLSK